jgi:hypothetical protein
VGPLHECRSGGRLGFLGLPDLVDDVPVLDVILCAPGVAWNARDDLDPVPDLGPCHEDLAESVQCRTAAFARELAQPRCSAATVLRLDLRYLLTATVTLKRAG